MKLLNIGYLIAANLVVLSSNGRATTLPADHELSHATQESKFDKELQDWFEHHAVARDFEKLDQEKIQSSEKFDRLTKLYAQLRAARLDIVEVEDLSLVATNANEYLRKYEKSHLDRHPLHDYINAEIIKLKTLKKIPGDTLGLRSDWVQSGTRVCSKRELLQDEFLKRELFQSSPDKIKGLLRTVSAFQSYSTRSDLFWEFLKHLPNSKRKLLKKELHEVAEEYPRLRREFYWLKRMTPSLGKKNKKVAYKGFEEVSHQLARRRCTTAQKALVGQIQSLGSKLDLEDVVKVGVKVGNCAKRRGLKKRIKVWADLTPILNNQFGDSGYIVGKMMVGRYQWTMDRFEAAKDSLNQILDNKELAQNELYSEALFLYAQILENEGDLRAAVHQYKTLVDMYPNEETVNDAFKAIILAYADGKEWDRLILAGKKLIYRQDELEEDAREVSYLGFALFWVGRSYVELGQKEKAKYYFARLSKEFYSTYYGAVGHFLLEEISEQRYAMFPKYTPIFDKERLFSTLGSGFLQSFARTEKLLSLGLREPALCEIREMDFDESNNQSVLARAMLFSMAGEWLNSIKLFNGLPRSYRKTLPFGMERVLFPRRYDESVVNFSGRLGVDPDFVFALIRQESVFNPKAKSAVGASGLMQLMRRTANYEVTRMKPSYVTKKQKKLLKRKLRRSGTLFDAETNLLVGTHHLSRLIDNYGEPVLTLSAYNAGTGPTSRWVKRYSTDDLLYFMERIPYRETRGYVKLVLRNYFYYKRWYPNGSTELPHLENLARNLILKAVNNDDYNDMHNIP